ncbi:DUF3618 domain-containing protein [Gleimia hominis]|uniref:DUF3618 domain-containing protein n=1 Tax=Gleimia hominis TaxID=595468 RepID=A0ABU3IAF4_9ACTO|nr:DUF3618 domain-containing protein [Gleimia hominis]MDT3766492.1 DUF3618 domain-containing protein [Gleimia hominis]
MSEEKPRTVEDIESELQRTRLAMQSTVDELTSRLDPRAQMDQAKQKARVKADEWKSFATKTVEDAKEGDKTAITRLASVAAGVAAIVGIALLRKK